MSISIGDLIEGEDVFEHVTAPVESVQDYVPGGLHLVHLGDSVGRYKILRKLGYGAYSTVWLAQEYGTSDVYVALKIVRADINCAQEVRIHKTLQSNLLQHPGQSHIMMLKDHFTIDGANGKHDCLGFEVLGPSIARVLTDPAGADRMACLTLSSARKVIYQVLLGLDYMHSVGLVHGDIYSGNVLFTIKDFSHASLDVLCQPQSQVSDEVKRVKGLRRSGDPRNLTLDWPLNHFVTGEGDVKLIDLGNSFSKHHPPAKLETPLEYRGPELIFDNHASEAQDCWALACFIYDILTNTPLFDLAFLYDKDSQNDAHMLQLFSLLGPLPTKMKHDWPRYDMFFNKSGQLQKFVVDFDTFLDLESENFPGDNPQSASHSPGPFGNEHQVTEALSDLSSHRLGKTKEFFDPDLYPSIVTLREYKPHEHQDDPESLEDFKALYPPLSSRWKIEKPPDMQPTEAEMVLNFLQKILIYDVGQRSSSQELLAHPWIRTYCTP